MSCTIARHIVSCISSRCVPPASQGAVLNESKSVSPDSSSHVWLNGIQTYAVICGSYFKLFIPVVVSGRPIIQNVATNVISGITPRAARANRARSSVRFCKASSESTRKHGGPTPRPTASKATFPNRAAGNSHSATGCLTAPFRSRLSDHRGA